MHYALAFKILIGAALIFGSPFLMRLQLIIDDGFGPYATIFCGRFLGAITALGGLFLILKLTVAV